MITVKSSSYTLIEILLVILIIGLIFGGIVSNFGPRPREEYETAKIDFSTLIIYYRATSMNTGIEGEIFISNHDFIITNSTLEVYSSRLKSLSVIEDELISIKFYPDGYISPCKFTIVSEDCSFRETVEINEFGKITFQPYSN